MKTHLFVGMVSFGLALLESYNVRTLPLPMVSRGHRGFVTCKRSLGERVAELGLKPKSVDNSSSKTEGL